MAERNEQGQFTKGNGGGPGRPKRSTEEKYLASLQSAVTLKEWRDIVDAAIVKAKRGDARARTWLSDYLLGPPVQKLQHQGDDGGPVKLVVEYVNKRDDNTSSAT
jgi:hypothetical protein